MHQHPDLNFRFLKSFVKRLHGKHCKTGFDWGVDAEGFEA